MLQTIKDYILDTYGIEFTLDLEKNELSYEKNNVIFILQDNGNDVLKVITTNDHSIISGFEEYVSNDVIDDIVKNSWKLV